MPAKTISAMVSTEKIKLLKEKIDAADAIVVGGASGMSAASGFVFYYMEDDVFRRLAGSIAGKYDIHNMFDAFYDRRLTAGERWAVILRTTRYIYECETGGTYRDLAELLDGKNFYVATTNQDAQFFRVFPANHITRIQGDWRYWQCSLPCHDGIYDNHDDVMWLCDAIYNDALPEKLIPRCPRCGRPMEPWVRSRTFLQGTFYHREMKRYRNFLEKNMRRNVLFLELGVGMMTPMFIKEPFMNMVYQWPHAYYVTINPQHAIVPTEIAGRSLAIKEDIAIALKQLLGKPVAGVKGSDARREVFNPSRVY